jgi:hypothetical protein
VRAPSSAAALFVCAIVGGFASRAAASDLAVAITSRALQPGEVVRVSIACSCDEAPAATVFDREIPLAPSGDGRWLGLVGVDLDVVPGVYPLVVAVDGSPAHVTPVDVQPKQFRTRTLRVATQFVDPSDDEIARILDEAGRLDRIFSVVTPPTWPRPFALPLPTTPSSNFGSRSVFNGVPRQPHAGVDFSSRTGTSVIAPAAGRVALAEDLFFTGRTVILDHAPLDRRCRRRRRGAARCAPRSRGRNRTGNGPAPPLGNPAERRARRPAVSRRGDHGEVVSPRLTRGRVERIPSHFGCRPVEPRARVR